MVSCKGRRMLPRMPDHEGHLLCGDIFSSNDEVAFILTVCGVQDNDEFTPSESVQSLLDGIEGLLVNAIVCHLDDDGGGWQTLGKELTF